MSDYDPPGLEFARLVQRLFRPFMQQADGAEPTAIGRDGTIWRFPIRDEYVRESAPQSVFCHLLPDAVATDGDWARLRSLIVPVAPPADIGELPAQSVLGYFVTDRPIPAKAAAEFWSWTENHRRSVGVVPIDLWSLFDDAFPWEDYRSELERLGEDLESGRTDTDPLELGRWFASRSGRLRCLHGSFGSGKSTLLKRLAARRIRAEGGPVPLYLDLRGSTFEALSMSLKSGGDPLAVLLELLLKQWTREGSEADRAPFSRARRNLAQGDIPRAAVSVAAMYQAGRLDLLLDNLDLVREPGLCVEVCEALHKAAGSGSGTSQILVGLRSQSLVHARATRRPLPGSRNSKRLNEIWDAIAADSYHVQVLDSRSHVKTRLLADPARNALYEKRRNRNRAEWSKRFRPSVVDVYLDELDRLTSRSFFSRVLQNRLDDLEKQLKDRPDAELESQSITEVLSYYVTSWMAEVIRWVPRRDYSGSSREFAKVGLKQLTGIYERYFEPAIGSNVGESFKTDVLTSLMEAADLAFAASIGGGLQVWSPERDRTAPSIRGATLHAGEGEAWSLGQLRDFEAHVCANHMLEPGLEPGAAPVNRFEFFNPLVRGYLLGIHLAARLTAAIKAPEWCPNCGVAKRSTLRDSHSHLRRHSYRECLWRMCGAYLYEPLAIEVASEFISRFPKESLVLPLERLRAMLAAAADRFGRDFRTANLQSAIANGKAFSGSRKLGPFKFLGTNAFSMLLTIRSLLDEGVSGFPVEIDVEPGTYLPLLRELQERPWIDPVEFHHLTDSCVFDSGTARDLNSGKRSTAFSRLLGELESARARMPPTPGGWVGDLLGDSKLKASVVKWFDGQLESRSPSELADEKHRMAVVVPQAVEWVRTPGFIRRDASRAEANRSIHIGLWVEHNSVSPADATEPWRVFCGYHLASNQTDWKQATATRMDYMDAFALKAAPPGGGAPCMAEVIESSRDKRTLLHSIPVASDGGIEAATLRIRVTEVRVDAARKRVDAAWKATEFRGELAIGDASFLFDEDVDWSDEMPMHRVAVDPFLMDIHPVSNCEWAAFLFFAGAVWGGDHDAIQAVRVQFGNPYYMFLWDRHIYGRFAAELGLEGLQDRTASEILARARALARNWEPPEPSDDSELPPYMENPEIVRRWLLQPVVYINYWAAAEFARWQGKRLPTESEWEVAARGGLVGQKFPWAGFTGPYPSSTINARMRAVEADRRRVQLDVKPAGASEALASPRRLKDQFERDFREDPQRRQRFVITRDLPAPGDSRGHWEPFGELDDLVGDEAVAKGYGVRHLVGNVSEWVADVHRKVEDQPLAMGANAPARLASALNPLVLAGEPVLTPERLGELEYLERTEHRVLRGGSFSGDVRKARCAHRDSLMSGNINPDVGFRCIQDF